MQLEDEALVLGPAEHVKRFERYNAMLAILPIVIYLAGFILVRVPSYERWGGSSWGPVLDYAFQTRDLNADVVIFGDSSALFAVDPIQMSRALGLKVVNLPNTIGGLPVVGDMALQRYLANTGAPPKLIVLYFSPWDLDYARAQGTRLFEGEEMLVRHGSWTQIISFGFSHPREVFKFPFRVYSGFGPGSLASAIRPLPGSQVAASRGHIVNLLPYAPLSSDCEIPHSDIQEQGAESVSRLMTKYSSPHTRTMLYLAPVPGCHNVASLLQSISEGPGVAPPPVFPPRDFTADGYYAHVKLDAVPRATELAVEAVRMRLNGAK